MNAIAEDLLLIGGVPTIVILLAVVALVALAVFVGLRLWVALGLAADEADYRRDMDARR